MATSKNDKWLYGVSLAAAAVNISHVTVQEESLAIRVIVALVVYALLMWGFYDLKRRADHGRRKD